MANETKYFLPKNPREWVLEEVPMIASVEIGEGSAIYKVEDGTHTKVTNATSNFKGILAEPIAATDADYATSLKLKKVWVPKTLYAQARFKVVAGTFTTADVGKSVKFSDETGLAVDTAGTQAVITGYIDSSYGYCTFNPVVS